jgi:putative flippase GtrA
MYNSSISRIVKFSLTGCIGMAIDFSLTILLKEILEFNGYLASLLGVLGAIVVIFLINKKWTFKNDNKNINKQFFQFLIIALIGCLWNSGLLFIFNQYFFLSFYLGKLLAIMIVAIWNYALNSIFTFNVSSAKVNF